MQEPEESQTPFPLQPQSYSHLGPLNPSKHLHYSGFVQIPLYEQFVEQIGIEQVKPVYPGLQTHAKYLVTGEVKYWKVQLIFNK